MGKGHSKHRHRQQAEARAAHDRAVAQQLANAQAALLAQQQAAAAAQAEQARKMKEETERKIRELQEANAREAERLRLAAEAAAAAAKADTDRKIQEAAAAAARAQAEQEARHNAQMEALRKQGEAQQKRVEDATARAQKAETDAARLRATTAEEREARFGIECPLDIDPNKINVAITGQSGSGKSSIINAIVGRNVAPVGVVQTTSERKLYEIPTSPVKLFDLPGAGTPEYPLETYYYEQGLKYFDIVLIVCANRFTQADIEIAVALAIQNIPFRLVRNMTATAVRNNARQNISEEQTVRTIREYLGTYLAKITQDSGREEIAGQDVFVIDSDDLQTFDGKRMTEWAISTIDRDVL